MLTNIELIINFTYAQSFEEYVLFDQFEIANTYTRQANDISLVSYAWDVVGIYTATTVLFLCSVPIVFGRTSLKIRSLN